MITLSRNLNLHRIPWIFLGHFIFGILFAFFNWDAFFQFTNGSTFLNILSFSIFPFILSLLYFFSYIGFNNNYNPKTGWYILKLYSTFIVAFLVTSVLSFLLCSEFFINRAYSALNDIVIERNFTLSEKNTNYQLFKKGLESSDRDILFYYNYHPNDLLLASLRKVEHIKEVLPKLHRPDYERYFNSLNSDDFISINEYEQFKAMVLMDYKKEPELIDFFNKNYN